MARFDVYPNPDGQGSKSGQAQGPAPTNIKTGRPRGAKSGRPQRPAPTEQGTQDLKPWPLPFEP